MATFETKPKKEKIKLIINSPLSLLFEWNIYRANLPTIMVCSAVVTYDSRNDAIMGACESQWLVKVIRVMGRPCA